MIERAGRNTSGFKPNNGHVKRRKLPQRFCTLVLPIRQTKLPLLLLLLLVLHMRGFFAVSMAQISLDLASLLHVFFTVYTTEN